jgi:hypothetical protein
MGRRIRAPLRMRFQTWKSFPDPVPHGSGSWSMAGGGLKIGTVRIEVGGWG